MKTNGEGKPPEMKGCVGYLYGGGETGTGQSTDKLYMQLPGGYYVPVHRQDGGVTSQIKTTDRKLMINRVAQRESHV